MVNLRSLGKFVVDAHFISSLINIPAMELSSDRGKMIKELEVDHPAAINARALYNNLLQEYYNRPLENKKVLYLAVILMEWLYHTKPGTNIHRANIKPDESLQLAKVHFELWQRDGNHCHHLHLQQSYNWFQRFFTEKPHHDDLEDLIIYFKVLQNLGDNESALQLISNIVSVHDTHLNHVNHLFYAGVVCKALRSFEKANNFFFESSQLGPPRFFSKLEMMVVISRTIEENGGEDEEANDEAYKMVHAHLAMEGLIQNETQYDDWIADAHTWISLADKCCLHQMYSLAADFYALAITRDPDAFKRPLLWLRFGKVCRKCGRMSDAQLAIKQALTRAPYNVQLQWIDGKWKEKTWSLDQFVEDTASKIAKVIPLPEHKIMRGIRLLQAVVRGTFTRLEWARGIGKTQRLSYKLPMATSAVQVTSFHDKVVFISIFVKANRMGKVSRVTLFDHTSDTYHHVRLKVPFAPSLKTGSPYAVQMSMETKVSQYDIDEQIYGKERTLIAITIRFNELQSSFYWERSMGIVADFKYSTFHEVSLLNISRKKVNLQSKETNGFSRSYSSQLWSASHRQLIKNLEEEEEEEKENQIELDTDASDIKDACRVSVVTNATKLTVAKFGFHWRGQYLLCKIAHETDFTQITFMSCRDNYLYVFLFVREYIDRSLNNVAACTRLLDSIYKHATLSNILDHSPSPIAGEDEGVDYHKTIIDRSKTYIYQFLPRSSGVSVIIAQQGEHESWPLLGEGFELWDRESAQVLPTLPSQISISSKEIATKSEGEITVGTGLVADSMPPMNVIEENLVVSVIEDLLQISIIEITTDVVKEEVKIDGEEESVPCESFDTMVINGDNDNNAQEEYLKALEKQENVFVEVMLEEAADELIILIAEDVARKCKKKILEIETYQQVIDIILIDAVDEALVERQIVNDLIEDVFDRTLFKVLSMSQLTKSRENAEDLSASSPNVIYSCEAPAETIIISGGAVDAVSDITITKLNSDDKCEMMAKDILRPAEKVVDQDEDDFKPSPYKFKTIKSRQLSDQVKEQPTLIALLQKRVKRMPVTSSVASALPDLVAGNEINEELSTASFSPPSPYCSVEALKNFLHEQSNDAFSLDSSSVSQSISSQLSLTSANLWKKPKLHKSHKKPPRIIFSSSFNPLQDKDDESSVGMSLSSTSWSQGKFSIERSIQSGDMLGLPKFNKKNRVANITKTRKERDLISYGDQEDGLLIQSVKNVQRLGYVPTMDTNGARPQRRPWAYTAYWQRLLIEFLSNHSHNLVITPDSKLDASSPDSQSQSLNQTRPFYSLKKQLHTLHKALCKSKTLLPSSTFHPMDRKGMLTVEEMICALAETKGSVGEALLRLHDSNMGFLSEIQLACGSINVRSLICSFPKGSDLLDHASWTLSDSLINVEMFQADRQEIDHNDIPISSCANANLKEDSNGKQIDDDVSNSTSISSWYEENISNPRCADDQKLPLMKSQLIKKLSRPESLPSLRDNARSTHLVYPQLQLALQSPLVLHRGSSVRFNPEKLGALGESKTGLSSFYDINDVEETESQAMNDLEFKRFSNPTCSPVTAVQLLNSSRENPILPENDSYATPHQKSVSFSPLQLPSETSVKDAVNSSWGDSSHTLKRHRSVSSDSGFGDNHSSILVPHKLNISKKSKSFRVHQQLVEERFADCAHLPMVILSRKDALKAHQEETLLKSNKQYITEPIYKKLQGPE